MADIRCPNCGKDNPDFFDVCQFCQAPLTRESMVHLGESPTKKQTGELEPILPEWLRDVRKQGRDSAEEDAANEAATKPKVQKEPQDLLAGLAFQAASEEEEMPDWLAGMKPVVEKPSAPASEDESPPDFFAQFNKSEPASAVPTPREASQEEVPVWMAGQSEPAPERDELTAWFSEASAQTDEQGSASGLDSSPAFSQEPAAEKEPEDLSWLHNLEDSSKQTAAPEQGLGSMANFEIPSAPASSASAPQEDLNWLNNLGGASAPAFEEPAPAPPLSSPQDDMSWLKNLGDTPAPSFDELSPAQPFAEQTDSGKPEEQEQDGSSPNRIAPFVPRRTAPLHEDDASVMPDWLKSAAEEPSMPLNTASMDWFSSKDQPADEQPPLSSGKPASVESNVNAPASDSSSLSNKDVDSMFSVEMPDWLSRLEPDASAKQDSAQPAQGGASLSPVDLPSWVQAMRPMEAGLDKQSSVSADQTTEREGPLAGFRGIIPSAPIGSSRRPKSFSLKLQATDEQQAGAALFEKILSSETNPRALATEATITTPRALRWLVTSLFMIVLGAMAYLRSEYLPVSAALPIEVRSASSVIARLPQNSFVLVVMDYEPALAAEMEAVSGPMLDQLALTTHARLTFLSTSPNGSALVRRLLLNTGISLPAPIGLDYKLGENYNNLGYLPGGTAGVREFIESPASAMPLADVTNFLQYRAVIVLTDHAESGRVWIEQLDARNQAENYFSVQPLLFAASAQAGPMLQPYFSSQQIMGMVSGLAEAVRYEFVNNSRPGTARTYWDSFGAGLLMAVVLITIGSLWSLFTGIRARRAKTELG